MAEVRLESIARECRVQILRMLAHAGSGHPGGSLSVIDILVTLFFGRLRHDPRRPDWADRDRVVLSKGHAVPALYTVMARSGYFPEAQLITLRKLGSPLQGHPDRTALPGIEAATGSLGQGLSISLGLALGLKLASSAARVYCILGDGEIQEGQVWEAAMSAPKLGQPDHALDNLVVIGRENASRIRTEHRQLMRPRNLVPELLELDGGFVLSGLRQQRDHFAEGVHARIAQFRQRDDRPDDFLDPAEIEHAVHHQLREQRWRIERDILSLPDRIIEIETVSL